MRLFQMIAKNRSFGLAIFVCLPLGLLTAQKANTGKSDHALAHVFVDVTPNIALQPIPQTPEQIQGVAPGSAFSIIARFNVAANTDRVEMGCVVSALHRASVASSVDRIPVQKSAGCVIEPSHANPMSGASSRALYQTDATADLSGFPAYPTNLIAFQSFQDARFNMDIALLVQYNIARLNMPKGQYGGIIKLVALIGD